MRRSKEGLLWGFVSESWRRVLLSSDVRVMYDNSACEMILSNQAFIYLLNSFIFVYLLISVHKFILITVHGKLIKVGVGEQVVPCKQNAVFLSNRGRGAVQTLSNEKSKSGILGNFIATEHIYIDISVNSAQISVEYSLLHVPCPLGCFVCIWRYLDQNWESHSLTSKYTHIHTTFGKL